MIKRLRYCMQRDGPVLGMVLRIFLRVIEQTLQVHCPGADPTDKANLHIVAVAFIHRFGSSLNEHVHFHVCAVDGVFEEEVAGEGGEDGLQGVCRAHGPRGRIPQKDSLMAFFRKIAYSLSDVFMLTDADNEGQSPGCPIGGLCCITAWFDQGVPVSVALLGLESIALEQEVECRGDLVLCLSQ